MWHNLRNRLKPSLLMLPALAVTALSLSILLSAALPSSAQAELSAPLSRPGLDMQQPLTARSTAEPPVNLILPQPAEQVGPLPADQLVLLGDFAPVGYGTAVANQPDTSATDIRSDISEDNQGSDEISPPVDDRPDNIQSSSQEAPGSDIDNDNDRSDDDDRDNGRDDDDDNDNGRDDVDDSDNGRDDDDSDNGRDDDDDDDNDNGRGDDDSDNGRDDDDSDNGRDDDDSDNGRDDDDDDDNDNGRGDDDDNDNGRDDDDDSDNGRDDDDDDSDNGRDDDDDGDNDDDDDGDDDDDDDDEEDDNESDAITR